MKKISKYALAAWAAFGMGAVAHAAGTAAGTEIENSATVTYELGGIEQPSVNSTTNKFLVDAKVDLIVVSQDSFSSVLADPGDELVFTFKVANIGNTAIDQALDATKLGDGIDLDDLKIYIDTDSSGGYNAGDTEVSYLNGVAVDTTNTVFLVGTVPGTGVQGADIGYALVATAYGESGSEGSKVILVNDTAADDPTTEDIVLADGHGVNDSTINDVDGDGKFADEAGGADIAYVVRSVQLTITKTSEIISDPVNGTSNPKAIPGALIKYTITVTSDAASSGTASDLTVTDDLSTQITDGQIEFKTNGFSAENGTSEGVKVIEDGGAPSYPTGKFNNTTGVLTVDGITVAPGKTATVEFIVEIL